MEESVLRSAVTWPAASTHQSELVVLIRQPDGRIVGQIDIDSHTRGAFGPDEEEAVRTIAQELGEHWPA